MREGCHSDSKVENHSLNIAFVLWGGGIGGTERLSLLLAAELQTLGHNTSIVLIGDDGDLRPQLDRESLEWIALGIQRGRDVLHQPRRVAQALSTLDTEVAVLGSFGFLGSALKVGGFRGAVIGVEHGALLATPSLPVLKRARCNLDRRIGARGHDAEVAVSEFMLRLQAVVPHSRRLLCIRHGVKVPDIQSPMPPFDRLRVGYVGRLIPGKGVDVTLRALDQLRTLGSDILPTLMIAGDGPDRPALEALALELHLNDQVEFIGWTDDVTSFWEAQHISIVPSNEFVESFCMAAVEAMAHGRPSIVSDRGALPELMVPDLTGSLVAPGDASLLADAIARYSTSPELISTRGVAAHERAKRHFTIERCADEYVKLANQVIADKYSS
jgi:glycosyltransferase involved in cell wall biosynthesis